MKTLPVAHKELVEKLEVELKELNKREPESRKLGNREEKQRKKLEASSSKLLEKVSALSDVVLTAVQNSVSTRIEAIQTAREAVKNILTEEGISVFLEKFAGVQEALERAHAVDFRRGLEPGTNRDKMILKVWESGDRIGEHISQLRGNFLALIDPDQQIPLSEITFDPNTVRERVSVSVDLKTLFYHPSNTYTIQRSTVFCKQNTSDGGNLHWIVKLTEHCDWSIGLRSKDNSIVHGLKWEKETLSCLNTECRMTQKCDNCVMGKEGRSGTGQMYHLSVSTINIPSFSDDKPVKALRPRKIEVFWDSESQVLSFYSRDRHRQGIQLCKIQLDRNEVLFPFVALDTVTTKCPNPSDKMAHRHYGSNEQTHTEIFCELIEE